MQVGSPLLQGIVRQTSKLLCFQVFLELDATLQSVNVYLVAWQKRSILRI